MHYCNNLVIKLLFSSFKIGNLFGMKDPVPDGLRSRVVYKFVCAGCDACYTGELCRHFSTRVREHLVRDSLSHFQASARFCTLSRFVFSKWFPCFGSRLHRFSTQDERGYSHPKRKTIL